MTAHPPDYGWDDKLRIVYCTTMPRTDRELALILMLTALGIDTGKGTRARIRLPIGSWL